MIKKLTDDNTNEEQLVQTIVSLYNGVKALAGPSLWGYSLVDLVADAHTGLTTTYIHKGVELAKAKGLLPE